jgi:transcription elongation factor GreA
LQGRNVLPIVSKNRCIHPRPQNGHSAAFSQRATFPKIPQGRVDRFVFVGYIFFLKGIIMARSPITRNGYNQLHKELENLKKVTRPQVIKAIEEARAHGDISENAEYVAAKERQSFVETKIREIEQKLANSEIIDSINLPNGKVGFGSVVTLENLDNGGKVTYQIVGPDESDISTGKISIISPLGKALLGKEADEEVAAQTPGGIKKYTVLKIC